MRILLLNRYSRMGASSRLRCLQYIPYLASQGVEVVSVPLFDDIYLNNLYKFGRRKVKNVFTCYMKRFKALFKKEKFDIIWIQYEMFPWFPEWIERIMHFSGIPYVVDYDDAIFHAYNLNPSYVVRALLKNKIEKIMQRASVVVTGNKYLAQHAALSGARRIEYIPTVVDMDRYEVEKPLPNERFTIGWIGSPKTSIYLDIVKPALFQCSTYKNFSISIVGAGPVKFENIDVKCYPWSEDSEVRLINSFDIGIMPLFDTPWEKGKCGYKLIQYMACGIPVVASPVGANKEIVRHGINGFLAGSTHEWTEAFLTLNNNIKLRRKMGEYGQKKVRDEFCLQVTGPRLFSIFQSIGEFK